MFAGVCALVVRRRVIGGCSNPRSISASLLGQLLTSYRPHNDQAGTEPVSRSHARCVASTDRCARLTRQTAAHQVLCRLRPACAPSSWCTRTARGCRRTGLALSARHIGRRGRAGAAAKRARSKNCSGSDHRRASGQSHTRRRRRCATTRRGGSGERDPPRDTVCEELVARPPCPGRAVLSGGIARGLGARGRRGHL